MNTVNVKTYNQDGITVKKKKVNWWKVKTNKGNDAICISLNSLDETPTKKGNGKEIVIKYSDLLKEYNKQ